jgi:BirA family biotin operon repressor/biotin-[acetyl-CoA-carboxylase] ligase
MSLNIRLLDQLRAVPGDYVPLGELGPDLEQVRRDLTSLVDFGFTIEQHPYRGASYVAPAERLCPDQIEHELATRWLARRVVVWNRVTSTNDLAARAGASRSNDGLVILAEEQTSGRGRRGRSWTAPSRSSILMSVVLFPPPHLMPADSAGALGRAWLTALAAIATAEVVSCWTGQSATIKWPNDVRVKGRKIAGILVEKTLAPKALSASPAHGSELARGAVIGIGLNANLDYEDFPPELAAIATSLQIERAGAPVDRSELARDLIRRLDRWYSSIRVNGPEALNTAWCEHSEHLGRLVKVATPGTHLVGRLVDLDVRFGVTLELSAGPVVSREETASQQFPGFPGQELSLPPQSQLGQVREASFPAHEACFPALAKLRLAHINSIEPLLENGASCTVDPDSRDSGSGRPAVLE